MLGTHTRPRLYSYGGKIDNRFDQTLLDCFLDKLFTPRLFDHEYTLIADVDGKSTPLQVPDETTRDAMLGWVNAIRPAQMPNWIGLPNNAEKVLLTVRGHELLRNLMRMSDDEYAYESEVAQGEEAVGPSWVVALSDMAQRWQKMLPKVRSRRARAHALARRAVFITRNL